jgi:hypothetical protein
VIEQGLVLLIQGDPGVSAIAATGGYFAELPKDSAGEITAGLPSWTYAFVTDGSEYTLDGTEGPHYPRIQFDCYGNKAAECIALANAIHKVLSGYHGILNDADSTRVQGIFFENKIDFFDSTSRTPRRMIEYYVWFNA